MILWKIEAQKIFLNQMMIKKGTKYERRSVVGSDGDWNINCISSRF